MREGHTHTHIERERERERLCGRERGRCDKQRERGKGGTIKRESCREG